MGSGPSLTADDVNMVVDARFLDGPEIRILAVADAYKLAPTADVLYAPDARWWDWNQFALGIPFRRYSLQQTNYAGVTRLAPGIQRGIETDARFLATGGHGGWQAINLAAHLGASTIVLLGYDMHASAQGQHHFFGEHPDGSHVRYDRWLPLYDDLPGWLAPLGITIVNATRDTAIASIPRVDLAACLQLISL